MKNKLQYLLKCIFGEFNNLAYHYIKMTLCFIIFLICSYAIRIVVLHLFHSSEYLIYLAQVYDTALGLVGFGIYITIDTWRLLKHKWLKRSKKVSGFYDLACRYVRAALLFIFLLICLSGCKNAFLWLGSPGKYFSNFIYLVDLYHCIITLFSYLAFITIDTWHLLKDKQAK